MQKYTVFELNKMVYGYIKKTKWIKLNRIILKYVYLKHLYLKYYKLTSSRILLRIIKNVELLNKLQNSCMP